MFMIQFRTEFRIPNSNGSVLIDIISKAFELLQISRHRHVTALHSEKLHIIFKGVLTLYIK
jgi:hypothetical protein